MFIVRDTLTRDEALAQADACLRLAAAIARGNEAVVPTADVLLHRVGRSGRVDDIVDSALGAYRDSELLPRSGDLLVALDPSERNGNDHQPQAAPDSGPDAEEQPPPTLRSTPTRRSPRPRSGSLL